MKRHLRLIQFVNPKNMPMLASFFGLALALATRSLQETTAPVDLGTAAEFTILAKTGISTVPHSVILGNIGVWPIASTAMTGFTLTAKTGYSTSTQVDGLCYGADYAAPTPSMLGTAILDTEAAYTDAASRASQLQPHGRPHHRRDFSGGRARMEHRRSNQWSRHHHQRVRHRRIHL